ncbi:hypothetical protein SAMN06265365_11434 [Tistlia consotensis]|uniref:PAS domain-containing protein n=1 Tax=Tistlia consotensis USBA 355 TaxID=560819 RepID=A0A1Y6B9M9_9PROT|nr:hypothetical protein [Tistlia consotensis]SMF00243.1 hypothetical protein SAMN05428998_102329 [Tistlia consotensis USBA 355]SNR76107.1 hypothetical protein SAMN06265365_11434 [Tistlia consotensis]
MSAFPHMLSRLQGSVSRKWDDAALWTMAGALAAGDLKACDVMMGELGSPPPEMLWGPTLETLPEPLLAFLLEWWNEARGAEFAPPVEVVDPFALRPALGHLSLLDVVDGGADFRYRIHGSLTAARARWEWTGRRVSEIETPMRFFFLVNYRAVVRRRLPLFSTHTPPINVRMTAWHRLILPLRRDDTVERLLVGILPTDRQDALADEDAPPPGRPT